MLKSFFFAFVLLTAHTKKLSIPCEPNIGIQVIYITCSWQVFVFPILQSPPDVAQIFWTCQLHTAWQLLHNNGGIEHPAVSWGWIIWKWQQRTTTRLLGAHCRHSLSEVARQCEADMSGKSVPHQEETGELETRRPRLPRLYIYSLESNQTLSSRGCSTNSVNN